MTAASNVRSEREPYDSNGKGPPHLLDGLEHLARVAIVGYDALVAQTSTPIRWTWHGVISERNHVEISGPSGGGKTTLAALFVVALASPTDTPVRLFGREIEPIPRGQFAVLIEEENGTHSIRRKVEIACEVLGLPVKETVDRIIVIVRRNVRVGDRVWRDLVSLGQRGGIGAAFIDSRARVLRAGESNSEEAQAAVAEELFALIEAARAPAFVISHTRKGTSEGIEDISGSGQRGAGADVILMLNAKRDARARVVATTLSFAKIRDDVEEHPDPVEFTLTKDAEGRWSLSHSAVAVADDRAPHERVAEFLAAKGPQTKNALRTALRIGAPVLEAAITRLFTDRRLKKSEEMVGGRPRPVFALRERKDVPHGAE